MSVTRTIQIRNLGKYERKCATDLQKEYGKFLRAVAAPLAIKVIQEQVSNTKPRPPIYTGHFKNSFIISSKFAKAGQVTITNTAKHAIFVEEGRRKGSRMPPVPKIEQWARDKLNLPPGKERYIAINIAKRIQARGIKPKNVLKRSLPKILAAYGSPLRMWVSKFWSSLQRYT